MDFQEATQAMYAKLQKVEPHHSTKILGWILMQDYSAEQVKELCRFSDEEFSSSIDKIKEELNLISKPSNVFQNQKVANRDVMKSAAASQESDEFHPEDNDTELTLRGIEPLGYLRQRSINLLANTSLSQAKTQNRAESTFPKDSICDVLPDKSKETVTESDLRLYQAADAALRSSSPILHDSSSALHEELVKSENYSRDFGTDSQSETSQDSRSSQSWKSPRHFRNSSKHGSNSQSGESSHEDSSLTGETFSSRDKEEGVMDLQYSQNSHSLERLELELQELLRAKQNPISIASLPQVYYERYGKTLKADGYLTESQRQGKTGYSLTKLLSKMKSSIVLIDRPNGQRAVTLKESFTNGYGFPIDSNDLYSAALPEYNDVNPSSRQIYLTFPPESTFSEEDVSAHFKAYGVVQDVRIPNQQKRMFGFVTFLSPVTVQSILAEGNPHYICGARVLVKPYKEKGKTSDKKKKVGKMDSALSNATKFPSSAIPNQYLGKDDVSIGVGMDVLDFDMLPGHESQKLKEIQLVDAQRRRLEAEARSLALQQQQLMLEAQKQKLQLQIQMKMNQHQMVSMDSQFLHPMSAVHHSQHHHHQNQLQQSQPQMGFYSHNQKQQQQITGYPFSQINSIQSPSSQIQMTSQYALPLGKAAISSQMQMGNHIPPANQMNVGEHIQMLNQGVMNQQAVSHLGSFGSQKAINGQAFHSKLPGLGMIHQQTELQQQQTEICYDVNQAPYNDLYQKDTSDDFQPVNPYDFVNNLVEDGEEKKLMTKYSSRELNVGNRTTKFEYEPNLPDSPFSSSALNGSEFSNEFFNHGGINDQKDLLVASMSNMSLKSFSTPSYSSPFTLSSTRAFNSFAVNQTCNLCFEQNSNPIKLDCHHLYCPHCMPRIKDGCLICGDQKRSGLFNSYNNIWN